MGAFDDLIPARTAPKRNRFDDLIPPAGSPSEPSALSGALEAVGNFTRPFSERVLGSQGVGIADATASLASTLAASFPAIPIAAADLLPDASPGAVDRAGLPVGAAPRPFRERAEQAEATMARVTDLLTYQPRTPIGKEVVAPAHEALQALAEGSRDVGEAVTGGVMDPGPRAGPLAMLLDALPQETREGVAIGSGAITEGAANVLPWLFGAKGLGKLGALADNLRPRRPEVAPEPPLREALPAPEPLTATVVGDAPARPRPEAPIEEAQFADIAQALEALAPPEAPKVGKPAPSEPAKVDMQPPAAPEAPVVPQEIASALQDLYAALKAQRAKPADVPRDGLPQVKSQVPVAPQQPTPDLIKNDIAPVASPEPAGAILPPAAPEVAQAPELPAAPVARTPDLALVTPEQNAVGNLPVQELPVAGLTLSKDVPQFKGGADDRGVVTPLGGEFDPRGVGPIQVWQRNDGRREVISGRHRLELAQRTNRQTIGAQVYREADGFTADDAAALDAELNIKDGQGSVADYAQYYKASGLSEASAESRGLLARAKGRTGWTIARDASAPVLAAHRAAVLTDEAAHQIAVTAPLDERLQAVGMQAVQSGKSIADAANTMRAVKMMAADRQAAGQQTDIFGFDDSGMREAEAMARTASSEQRQIREQVAAVQGAAKRPEQARKLGVDVKDPAGVQKRVEELKGEAARWQNWTQHPDLVAKVRDAGSPYVAFFPEQIKSVGNRGTYSPTDPNILNSRGSSSIAAHDSAQSFRRELINDIGGKTVRRLEDSGLLKIGTQADFGWEGTGIEGSWDGVNAQLAWDAIPKGGAVGRLLHEVGEHAGMEKMLGPDKYAALQKRFDELLAADDPAAVRADNAVPKNTPADHRQQERLAYLIADVAGARNRTKFSKAVLDLVQEIIARIRAWLFKNLPKDFVKGMALTPRDIAALARAAVDFMAKRGRGAAEPMAADEAYASRKPAGRPSELTADEATERAALLDTLQEVTVDSRATGNIAERANAADALAEFDREHGIEADEDGNIVKPFDLSNQTEADLAAKAERETQRQPEPVARAEDFDLEQPDSAPDAGQRPLFSRKPDEKPFYSALTRAVDAVKMPNAPASQWAAWLKNREGVKREEIEWSGIEQWLAQQGDRKVSRAEVTAFLRANEIQVEEVVKGAEGLEELTSEIDTVKVKLDAKGYSVLTDSDRVIIGVTRRSDNKMFVNDQSEFESDGKTTELPPDVQELYERANDLTGRLAEPDNDAASTRHSSWQLPGAKPGSYRELLLTLPVDMNREHDANSARLKQLIAERDAVDVPNANRGQRILFRNLDTQINLVMKERQEEGKRTAFKSSHFDEPNIVAHVRFNERTDADGKRTLFIEEIQSDWHQKGRKGGYAETDTVRQAREADEKVNGMRAGVNEMLKRNDNLGFDSVGQARSAIASEDPAAWEFDTPADLTLAQEWRTASEESNRLGKLEAGGVPDAPFKTTWPMLAFKRVLRHAVAQGYDRVAWTTGAQQADRYDLSRQVESIKVTLTDDSRGSRTVRVAASGNRSFIAVDVDGDGNIFFSDSRPELNGKPLADVVGKEMADKIMNAKADRTFDGGDLKVGGEGMAGFYDRMLPAEVNKYVKKWGGKVGQTTIKADNAPEEKVAEVAARDPDHPFVKKNRMPVHSLPITDAMRDSVQQGQPLFSMGRDERGEPGPELFPKTKAERRMAQDTSIKNAETEAQRESRGMPAAEQAARRDFGEVWEDAKPRSESDWEAINALVEELKTNPRPVTDTEDAMLLHRQIRLQNQHDKLLDTIADADTVDPVELAEARAAEATVSAELEALYDVTKAVGTATARGLNARRIMARHDYTLAAMTSRLRAAKGGEPLTPKESEKVKDLGKKLRDLDEKVDEREADAHSKRVHTQRNAENLMGAEAEAGQAKQTGKPPVDRVKAAKDKVQRRIKQIEKVVEEEGTVSRNLIQALAREAVEMGERNRVGLVNTVHGILTDLGVEMSKREVMDAISGYGDFRALSKEEIDVELRRMKGELQQVGKLEDMQKGQPPLKSGVERRTPSDAERALIKQVNEMKKRLGIRTTDPETQLKSALDAIKTRLKNQITDYESQLEAKAKIVKTKTPPPTDAAANALRKRRDELKAKFDEMFGKDGITDEQRIKLATAAVEKSIAEYDRKIKEGDLSPMNRESKTPSTPALEALRAKREALREELQALRDAANPKRTPDEIALQSLKTRLKNRIAELHEKMAAGDFEPKVRRETKVDEEASKLRFEAEAVKRQYNEMLLKYRLAQRGRVEKVFSGVVEGMNFARALVTSFDFGLSALLRQGGFSAFSHPLRTASVLPDWWRGMRTKEGAFRVNEQILARPKAPLYKRDGLYLADQGDSLAKMEEIYMSRWAMKVPGVANAARGYTTILNRLRADSYDALADTLTLDGKPTKIEGKAIANMVNITTGRGHFGATDNAGVVLNTGLFSPRYLASRFQMLLGQPFYKGTADTRKLFAREYARFIIGLGVFYGLASTADDVEIETDSRSSDFGKIRIGNARLDPLGGLLQIMVLASRIATGETKTLAGDVRAIRGEDVEYGQDKTSDFAWKFLRNKFSPVVGQVANVIDGEDFLGRPVTPYTVAEALTTPMYGRDIYEVMTEEQNIERATTLSLLGFIGMGLQYHQEKE